MYQYILILLTSFIFTESFYFKHTTCTPAIGRERTRYLLRLAIGDQNPHSENDNTATEPPSLLQIFLSRSFTKTTKEKDSVGLLRSSPSFQLRSSIMPLFTMSFISIFHDIHFQFLSSNTHLKYFLAGGVCASMSHAIAVPVDVIKVRMQSFPEIYSQGILGTGYKIVADEGFKMLFNGMGPTILGYCVHGSLK